jgi:malonyl-CoA/methylmalonyl-CoA synthetase
MNANLYALLRSHFAEHLEQPCVLIPGGPVIHYDDLDAAAARIAHALLAAGCVLGDRVAVQTDKCWQVLAVYLARAPAWISPAPQHRVSQSRTRLFLWRRLNRVIVCAPADAADIAALRIAATVLTLAGDEAACSSCSPPGGVRDHDFGPGDLATLLYTRGRPAARTMLTHRPGHQRWRWSNLGLHAR